MTQKCFVLRHCAMSLSLSLSPFCQSVCVFFLLLTLWLSHVQMNLLNVRVVLYWSTSSQLPVHCNVPCFGMNPLRTKFTVWECEVCLVQNRTQYSAGERNVSFLNLLFSFQKPALMNGGRLLWRCERMSPESFSL